MAPFRDTDKFPCFEGPRLHHDLVHPDGHWRQGELDRRAPTHLLLDADERLAGLGVKERP